MKIDVDAIFSALESAGRAFELVQDLVDGAAEVLAQEGQPLLQQRLIAFRIANDEARARRAEKLAQAAKT